MKMGRNLVSGGRNLWVSAEIEALSAEIEVRRPKLMFYRPKLEGCRPKTWQHCRACHDGSNASKNASNGATDWKLWLFEDFQHDRELAAAEIGFRQPKFGFVGRNWASSAEIEVLSAGASLCIVPKYWIGSSFFVLTPISVILDALEPLIRTRCHEIMILAHFCFQNLPKSAKEHKTSSISNLAQYWTELNNFYGEYNEFCNKWCMLNVYETNASKSPPT
jgi:hypothetical protein